MEQTKKTCFVIMPISDQDGYEKGHFTRVYNHLIKPACLNAGFEAIRADDEAKTNYIVIDVIKKIIDSEIVICDLSAKNPNVLYELGIRQAFNKKVVLIKDNKTTRIFDIQGLRTLDYDENLRIDEVQKNIGQISKTIKDTFESKSDEINSLIQLLSIQPAVLPQQIEISKESSLIMDILNNINNRLSFIEEDKNIINSNQKGQPYDFNFDGYLFNHGDELHSGSESLGQLIDVTKDFLILKKENKVYTLKKTDPRYNEILPF